MKLLWTPSISLHHRLSYYLINPLAQLTSQRGSTPTVIIILTSGLRSLLNVAFSCLLIKTRVQVKGAGGIVFPLSSRNEGNIFFPSSFSRREDIYLEWTHHSASPAPLLLPSFFLPAVFLLSFASSPRFRVLSISTAPRKSLLSPC